MKIAGTIAILCLMLPSVIVLAGDEPRLWTQYIQEVKLGKHWRWMSDVGVRSIAQFGHPDFAQFRSGFSYDILPQKLSLEVGTLVSQDWNSDRKEIRPHYHLLYSHKTSNYSLNLRLRMEERFMQTEENGRQKSWRPRLLAGIKLPLYHPKSDIEKKQGLWLGHEQEILWKMQESQYTGFNQYRFIQGLGWTFKNRSELSANYFVMLGESLHGVWLRFKIKL